MIVDGTIYSIGHGAKSINALIEELKSFDISFLLDVRSKPYSKWNPQFNKEAIDESLGQANIKYAFFGMYLGGLPNDPTCYDENGKVVYNLIRNKDFFKIGIERILTANKKNIKLAIMCSESNPSECHRSKLIGQALLNKGISVKHILTKGKVKLQEEVISEVTRGKGLVDLFGDVTNLTSRKTY